MEQQPENESQPALDDAAALPSLEEEVETIFDDPESRRNVVGLFDLLLKIDRRIHPQDHENHD